MRNCTMNNTMAVIGIDIGGSKISAALFQHDGSIVQKEIRSVAGKKGKQVADLVGDLLCGLIDLAKNTSYTVVAIGVCVPGIYNPIKKTVWAPNIADWGDYPLWDEMTNRINDPSIVIVVESDRSCYILGEVWKGSAQACKDAIFIAVGTGIGAGILSNGKIIGGNKGIAGAIGWMALESPYDNKYDACGNFEYYASGNGISRSAIEELQRSADTVSVLRGIPANEITSQHVFDAYEEQDPIAVKVIDKAVRYWGRALANLVSIFNPQKVIFGGGVFGPAIKLLDNILEESKKWAQPLAIQEMTLESSALQGDAGLIGAGYLAIQTINDRPHGE